MSGAAPGASPRPCGRCGAFVAQLESSLLCARCDAEVRARIDAQADRRTAWTLLPTVGLGFAGGLIVGALAETRTSTLEGNLVEGAIQGVLVGFVLGLLILGSGTALRRRRRRGGPPILDQLDDDEA